MFRRGNPFVRAREETSSTHGVSHLRAGLSLSWPSHVHIQPNLLKSCQVHQPANSTNWRFIAAAKRTSTEPYGGPHPVRTHVVL